MHLGFVDLTGFQNLSGLRSVTKKAFMRKINIFWFRRDLRLNDNAGLYHALKKSNPVLPIFIFDANILNKLDNKEDRRVAFIHKALAEIQEQLKKIGSSIQVHYGTPLEVYKKLLSTYTIEK